MNNGTTEMELLPDPERIVYGLRDTGYNFNTAIADIVDNSISAKATTIDITVNLDPSIVTKVYIADNGTGMDKDGLINAMKYGSKERPDKNSLGKFGLGLKTASTAFCKQLSVVSRPHPDDKLVKVQWDLDYIGKSGTWTLLLPETEDDEIDLFEATAGNGSGTLVIWDKVDRLLKDYKTFSNARKGLDSILSKLRFHLSMVFQRFLDTADNRASDITIRVNGIALKPWNPFCTSEPKTIKLQEETVPVNMPDGTTPTFHIAAYVIPKKGEYTSLDAEKEAQGSNDFQGIYVYRENRLIHSGDWFGFLKKEPHFSLLRVSFSFDYRLDELLSVDIKKSRILLIGELAQFIIDFLGAPRREAEKRYREKENHDIIENSKIAHKNSNENIEDKATAVEQSKITPIGNNLAKVENGNGVFTKTITIQTSIDPKQTRVIPVSSIDGGALWEPSLTDNKHAVNINESHPFYKKVYGPYLSQSIVVQGLDYLLWALAEAENKTCDQDSIENYEDMRFTVSRILKKLVASLPEPETEE